MRSLEIFFCSYRFDLRKVAEVKADLFLFLFFASFLQFLPATLFSRDFWFGMKRIGIAQEEMNKLASFPFK